jgi:hypothetical protein
MRKKLTGLLILLAGIMLAFTLVGCGSDDGGPTGASSGGGGLSGTYSHTETEEGMTITMSYTFSGSRVTMKAKWPAIPGFLPAFDDWVARANYTVTGDIVRFVPPFEANPNLPSGFIDGDDIEDEDYYLTIVNANTLRDSEGTTFTK